MPCCPFFFRCLMVGLLSAPLVIGALACNNSASTSAPASKAAPDTSTSKPKEPVDIS